MGDEQIFDLLRIDIHAARDNHEALSIGQIQIAVGVDMPDIAERAPLRMVRMTRIACLFGVVEILEIPSALEIDEAVDARRHLASLLVADMKRAPIGAPDRSRPFEPLLRSDEGRAIRSTEHTSELPA